MMGYMLVLRDLTVRPLSDPKCVQTQQHLIGVVARQKGREDEEDQTINNMTTSSTQLTTGYERRRMEKGDG